MRSAVVMINGKTGKNRLGSKKLRNLFVKNKLNFLLVTVFIYMAPKIGKFSHVTFLDPSMIGMVHSKCQDPIRSEDQQEFFVATTILIN
jgi:hypothetical protein